MQRDSLGTYPAKNAAGPKSFGALRSATNTRTNPTLSEPRVVGMVCAMKIECHIIQNFPPNCLNRDDTNSPKDCEFGGVRRARISSQCFKRAVRDAFAQHQSFSPKLRAVRTKRIVEHVVNLVTAKGRAPEDAKRGIVTLLTQVDLKLGKDRGDDKTAYLLFLPERKIAHLATILDENWDALLSAAQQAHATRQAASAEDAAAEPNAKGKAKTKSKSKDTVELPKELKASVESLLKDSRETPEIALFGRMIADCPDWNVEAACQVAQALSTHRLSMEFDFFTAVDDLKKDTESGSDMMGTVQFNSACFYRYAVVDCDGLQENLGGSAQADLCKATVEAFLQAFVHARPTGKQNSMAAHTLPSLVLVTVRRSGEPLSLANAFVKPVTVHKADEDLEKLSTVAMRDHFAKLSRMYPEGLSAVYACSLDDVDWDSAAITPLQTVAEVIKKACGHIGTESRAA